MTDQSTDPPITSHDLVVLTAWMAQHGYEAADIAHAVEKPWKYLDELARAHEGRPPADVEGMGSPDGCGICGDPLDHGGEPHGVATGDGRTRADSDR
jgi:hypothetical protein